MPGAGRMRERVIIQTKVFADDGMGGGAASWEDVATVWGQVSPLRGMEALHALQMQAAVSHRVTIRYLAGVTAAMRVLWGERTFNIRSVINSDERRRYLQLMCEEGVGE